MSLTYFLNDLEMVQVAPIITGITLVFTFHMRCISIVSYYYYYYYYVAINWLTSWRACNLLLPTGTGESSNFPLLHIGTGRQNPDDIIDNRGDGQKLPSV